MQQGKGKIPDGEFVFQEPKGKENKLQNSSNTTPNGNKKRSTLKTQ